MSLVYRTTLLISAIAQMIFGLLFLAWPELFATHADIGLTPAVHSLFVNLGALVLFVAAMCGVTLAWLPSPRAYQLGGTVGALLCVMGVGHALIGVWPPVLWDGGRGALLLVLTVALARRDRRNRMAKSGTSRPDH